MVSGVKGLWEGKVEVLIDDQSRLHQDGDIWAKTQIEVR